MSNPLSLRLRMYRQGLGDCFLLRFPRAKGGPCHVVIDSGVLKGTPDSKARMTEVARDITQETGGKLDLLVVTHEHWDHVSGFTEAREIWSKIKIAQTWLAWTEDPGNTLAKKLRADREARKTALVQQFTRLRADESSSLRLDGERSSRIAGLLGFLGVDGSVDNAGGTAEALHFIAAQAAKRTYCSPGETLRLPGVKGVHAFVLGPPEDEKLIKKSDPSTKTPEVYEDTGHPLAFGSAMDADVADPDQPFPAAMRRAVGDDREYDAIFEEYYKDPKDPKRPLQEQPWQKLEFDSILELERLALALDGDTNNTSLVLAFELGAGGPVLLFPADAQVGNWLSWQKVEWKTGAKTLKVDELFARTVLYKVGHHGSHNATLKDLGLEKMTHRDLIALIPVEQAMARKKKWQMPFPPLHRRLLEKTRGRVVLADADEPPPIPANLNQLTPSERKRFGEMVTSTELFHDITIPL